MRSGATASSIAAVTDAEELGLMTRMRDGHGAAQRLPASWRRKFSAIFSPVVIQTSGHDFA